jgi:hypothetical protein
VLGTGYRIQDSEIRDQRLEIRDISLTKKRVPHWRPSFLFYVDNPEEIY